MRPLWQLLLGAILLILAIAAVVGLAFSQHRPALSNADNAQAGQELAVELGVSADISAPAL